MTRANDSRTVPVCMGDDANFPVVLSIDHAMSNYGIPVAITPVIGHDPVFGPKHPSAAAAVLFGHDHSEYAQDIVTRWNQAVANA